MASPDDALQRIDALIQVAMRLAASAPSGRIALAKLASALEERWIPRPWRTSVWPELERARAAAVAEPMAPKAVERALREAWGASPSDELDELDTEPVAVTPTSQVHRAVLDGGDVAVKLLRPGLAGVRQDLALLEGLAGPLASAFPGIDPQAILREVRERVLDELDLEHEAETMRRFRRGLRNHPQLVVPAPATSLARPSVLVSEWIDGVPLTEAGDRDHDRAAAWLVIFALGGIRAGLVHADPDPEDVLEMADGRLAVLDYGATRTVSRQRASLGLQVAEAFAAGDGAALGRALQELGALPADQGPKALELARIALGKLGEPGASRLDSDAVVAVGRRAAGLPDTATELAMQGGLPPEDLWPLRGAALAFGTVARLGADGDWLELTVRALREGWQATPPD
ncbi:MAG TPA: AarF/UbiB family protein [Solirubrobacteraceae bacterium]|nr:AarF/UbiB family protein [Solirubrobacteraceae bacterium]